MPLHRNPYPPRRAGFLSAFIFAWRGLIHTVVHQRNMRVHLVAGVLVGLVGMGLQLGLAEKVTLIFCVLLIFFAEVLNSALEHLVDLAIQEFDEKARVAKDAAAAGVLVLATGTVVIFAALLVHNRDTIAQSTEAIGRQVALGLPLAGCAALLVTPGRRGPWVDALALVAALGLLAALAPHSASNVFTAMTFGLLVVAGDAARTRHREARALAGS